MDNIWASDRFSETLTGAEPWELSIDYKQLHIFINGREICTGIDSVDSMTVTKGWFWSTLKLSTDNDGIVILKGISNWRCDRLHEKLTKALNDHKRDEAIQQTIESFDQILSPIKDWSSRIKRAFYECGNENRWITEEMIQQFIQTKPEGDSINGFDLDELLNDPQIQEKLREQPVYTQNSIKLWQSDIRLVISTVNKKHMTKEMEQCQDFFRKVDKDPLSGEQIEAVVCFDNRVKVIAAAGSGKTSTIIAKTGYALKRNLVRPDQILILAFNDASAKELQSRVQERLAPLGLAVDSVTVKTFHAFGIHVIGQATGKRPSLARWVEEDRDIEYMSEIVDELKTRSQSFRARWALFRMVFARDVPRFGTEGRNPEYWDPSSGKRGFKTLQGEVVKSESERLIADWLFFNGIEYKYEMPYEYDTADAEHGQYCPDFYYPKAGLYHEHFALDQHGNAPPEFTDYMEGVRWKRGVHPEYGTDLMETTSADIWSGRAFEILEEELTKRGVNLDPDPDRTPPEGTVIEDKALVRLFRSFLRHAKSNRLSDTNLRDNVKTELFDTFTYRHRMFLYLFNSIREEWERHLEANNAIDFEDMINRASDHIKDGDWEPPYALVMVDEFQDTSQARARLVRFLVSKPGRHLFAVGDDWQSINRFAGSDISVMTRFNDWFGFGTTIRLQRTYRCPQEICDVSSQFVLKNPHQINKEVVSYAESYKPAIEAFEVNNDKNITVAIKTYLEQLYEEIQKGNVARKKKRKIEVFVVGRYRHDKKLVPKDVPVEIKEEIEVRFSTVHGLKGLETDYVIIPRLITGRYGFPSNIEDDPVMQLVIPFEEEVEHAEERRLFYVAMTRPRRSVALLTVRGRCSPFLAELINDHEIKLQDITGNKNEDAKVCSECGKGTMVLRRGPYGEFYGCSRFPQCSYSYKVSRGNNL